MSMGGTSEMVFPNMAATDRRQSPPNVNANPPDSRIQGY